MPSREFTCYYCGFEDDEAEHIIQHTVKHHENMLSIRRRVLYHRTGNTSYQSLHFGIPCENIKQHVLAWIIAHRKDILISMHNILCHKCCLAKHISKQTYWMLFQTHEILFRHHQKNCMQLVTHIIWMCYAHQAHAVTHIIARID